MQRISVGPVAVLRERSARPSPERPAQWISDLEITEYEGADHFFYLSRTEEVKDDILDFARALPEP
jgi:pimeloyl-ACP methyl ester carboxylesterase